MNILEAEDVVKGLPDQVLFQYAQNPPPQIPQYLAVSEVQRRQEMRQRFQSQQAAQQQPTVKDQILQGGIAAAGGPPPGGEQPPMAPPGGAPPGAPMEQPMTGAPMGGMFRGGVTRMAMGGLVIPELGSPSESTSSPGMSREAMIRRAKALMEQGRQADALMLLRQAGAGSGEVGMYSGGLTPGGIVYMEDGRTVPGVFSLQHQLPGLYTESGELKPGVAAVRDFLAPRRAQFSVIREAEALRNQGRLDEAVALLRSEGIDPSRVLGERPAAPPAAPAAAPAAAPGPVDFMAAQRQPQTNFNMPPPAPIAAPQAAPQAAPPAPPPPNVPPGGIGDLAPRQQTGGIPSYLANLLTPQERSPEVQAAIDLNRQMAEQGLPAPVDLSQYVKSAQQRQQEAQAEARRMAIANTLMGLGTGLVAGDPAAGLQRATQMATETLREGRKEAQAEGRMAEQLQLQQAQQQRQAALDAMKFKSESVNAIANLVSGEEKANRNDRLQAAQIVATYNAALDRNRAELESQGRLDERSLRTARTAALQSAREIYLANPANVTGKTNDEIARELSEMARMLDPDSFGSSGTTAATPSGKSRFTITEVRTGR